MPRFTRRLKPYLFRSERGAFDLGSIIVGVVVSAILITSGLLMVAGGSQGMQDSEARTKLTAASTAQSASKSTSRRYFDKAELVEKSILDKNSPVGIKADGLGSCFVAVSASTTGRVFYITNQSKDPMELIAGANPGCLTVPELDALVDGVETV